MLCGDAETCSASGALIFEASGCLDFDDVQLARSSSVQKYADVFKNDVILMLRALCQSRDRHAPMTHRCAPPIKFDSKFEEKKWKRDSSKRIVTNNAKTSVIKRLNINESRSDAQRSINGQQQ